MALTERAMQVVQAPLRLVQEVAGGAGPDELRSELEEVVRPLRSDVRDLDQRLTAIERKLDQINEDTRHIRTEQAAEEADQGS